MRVVRRAASNRPADECHGAVASAADGGVDQSVSEDAGRLERGRRRRRRRCRLTAPVMDLPPGDEDFEADAAVVLGLHAGTGQGEPFGAGDYVISADE